MSLAWSRNLLKHPAIFSNVRWYCHHGNINFDKLVNNNKVVVFMKGVPDDPRCGFSNAVVQIFRMHGVKYDAHDVLKDDHVRQGIKDYTNWPTIPQVFIGGQFIGGCDIMLQLHQSGDLITELDKVGISSALADKEGPGRINDPKLK